MSSRPKDGYSFGSAEAVPQCVIQPIGSLAILSPSFPSLAPTFMSVLHYNNDLEENSDNDRQSDHFKDGLM